MERVGDAVGRELSRFGPAAGMAPVVEAWPAAVGAQIARNAWPARLARDGTLHVNTSSSVWAFELGQLAPQILERLRAELGEAAPAALRFAQGHLPEPAPARAETPANAPSEPSPEATREAAALAAGIADDELRKRVERAVSLGLSARGDDR
jgi:predicted nucleic acid-binding Zn ribbon protein